MHKGLLHTLLTWFQELVGRSKASVADFFITAFHHTDLLQSQKSMFEVTLMLCTFFTTSQRNENSLIKSENLVALISGVHH